MAENDGEDGDGRREGPVEGTGDVSVSWAERVVMLVALGFTAALFSFAVWQALTGATAVPPSANVTDVAGGTENVTDVAGGTENVTYYVVTLRNDGDAGLVSATVDIECPTTSRSVTFENVPSKARRNATVRDTRRQPSRRRAPRRPRCGA